MWVMISPRGEGKASNAQWKAEMSGLFSAHRMFHPLPNGEVWGLDRATHPHPTAGSAIANGFCRSPATISGPKRIRVKGRTGAKPNR